MVHEYINDLVEKLRLPAEFVQTVDRWYRPLAQGVATLHSETGNTLVLGVQGVQGSGKSTLAEFLKILLQNGFGLRAVVLSIDDFYLTRRDRLRLAESVHPLLATRGVPGTHDVKLARTVIDKLKQLQGEETLPVPRFNKALDDREPRSDWDTISGPVDIVILEGWCVAAPPQSEASLRQPINALERQEDPDGIWRRYVNDQLKLGYAELFSRLDALIVLAAPSFECAFEWRRLQEQKLKEKWQAEHPGESTKIQTPNQLKRFISHYERISRHCLAALPPIADWLLSLNEKHDIVRLDTKAPLLFVTDLDGTLLDHRSYSWEAAIPAIEACRKKHIPIIINTSKTRQEVILLQESLGLNDPFIVENGSAVYLPKSPFGACPDGCLDAGDFWQIRLGRERHFIIEKLQTLRSRHGWRFKGFYDWTIDQVATYTGLKQEQAKAALNRQFSEPLIWEDSEENFAKFASELEKDRLKIIRGGRFVHVTGDCDKGRAMQWLANRYGRSPKVVALGDGPNDIDMLSIADYAVVVKSSAHAFPEFDSRGKKTLTSLCGPEGWNCAVLDFINRYGGEEK